MLQNQVGSSASISEPCRQDGNGELLKLSQLVVEGLCKLDPSDGSYDTEGGTGTMVRTDPREHRF